MKNILFLPLLFLVCISFSQNTFQKEGNSISFKRCGMTEYENYLRTQDPEYDVKKQEVEKTVQTAIKQMQEAKWGGGDNPSPAASYIIPVVFHVVYNVNNASAENLPDDLVRHCLDQLNLDWSRTNTDTANTPTAWKSLAANMQVQFCLANIDPNGNPTTGIVHKATATTLFGSDNKVKHTSQGGDDAWNPNKYLNIWICNLGSGLLGYGSFPPIGTSGNYGTVVHYTTIGSMTNPNPSGSVFGYGRTLSHEIGHCFNLIHIWGDDNGGCSGTDLCSDTPNMGDATSGCPSGEELDGCNTGTDGSPASDVSPGRMYQNFMDYTDDMCYNMFTAGQKTRVQGAIFSYLNSVANNAATACSALVPDDAGISSVSSPKGNYCVTASITPSAQVQNFGTTQLTACDVIYQLDTLAPDTFNWSGSLATHQSDIVSLPTFTTTAGTHTFMCITINPNGGADGNPINDTTYIFFNVFNNVATATAPYVEGFEDTTFLYADCYLLSDDTTAWERTTTASYTDSSSLMLHAFSHTNLDADEFITPAIDMTSITSPTLTFKLSHAQASATDADKLTVFTSSFCGSAWVQRYSKSAANLATVTGTVSSDFVPSSTADWRAESVNVSNIATSTAARIKFVFSGNGAGNNIYIDDINIMMFDGVAEEYMNGFDFLVSPNPLSDEAKISFTTMEKYIVSLEVYDVVGRKVITVQESAGLSSGNHSYKLNRGNFQSGIYFVKLNVDNHSIIKKIIIQ